MERSEVWSGIFRRPPGTCPASSAGKQAAAAEPDHSASGPLQAHRPWHRPLSYITYKTSRIRMAKCYNSSWKTHLRATEHHPPYGITYTVTCHPTHVNALGLNPSQIGQYLIYLPQRDEKLSWHRRLVTYRDNSSGCKQSPIQVLNWPGIE